MMEKKAFLISVVLSLLSMFLIYQYIDTQEKELLAQYGMPFKKMVVARRDILQYETIRPSDVEEIAVPNSMVPPGVIENIQDVVDAVAAVPIMKREQILDNKIVSKNVYSGLDTQIGLNRRAVSIFVNIKSSAGYMLRPGNRVDLAAHFEYKAAGTSIEETKIFLQDLLVLAAGRTIQASTPKGVDQSLLNQIEQDQKTVVSRNRSEVQETLNYVKTDTQYQTVTLEVTAEQAQKVVYVAAVFGDSLSLLLRNSEDRQIAKVGSTNFRSVMGDDSYYVNGPKKDAPMSVPRIRFKDYLGELEVPVYK